MTERDLIEIRDIGDPNSAMYGLARRLAVSPDGTHMAFSLVRADLQSNGYCRAVYVSDVRAGAIPRLVDTGGDYRASPAQVRGYYANNGSMEPTIPVWSPDGRTVAFLRSDRGVTQAWIAKADGTGSRALSTSRGDVTAVAWNSTGTRLLCATSPSAVAEREGIDREAETGWLYDDRVFASYDLRPLVAVKQQYVVMAVDVATGAVTPAEPGDASRIPADYGVGYTAPPEALAADGRRAWGEHVGGGAQTPIALTTQDASGRKTTCSADWCRSGIYGLWWDPSGSALYVQRREGWNRETTAFYRWIPGAARAKRLLATTDVVQDCAWAARGFVCTHENATTPRHIVLIDRASGRLERLFDPNPGFATIKLGSVRRLRAKNELGLPSWADLVLPTGYRSGTRLPLVIVQYSSQGFLRGGTGNEYPIYLLAQRGFAVLSVERPAFFAAAFPNLKTAFEVNAADFTGWADRRNVLSSLLASLDQAVATGNVDERRVGITGLSDGASTARFAMLNSTRFAAAAASTCCYEPTSVMSANGPAFAAYLQKMGFPPATRPDHDFWKDYSLSVSGARTNTPFLLLLAEHEAGSALETFQAMREYSKPIEMYVYGGEYHVKWQPQHKLSVGERAADWFAFWLQDVEDPDPAKQAQYVRWRALKSLRKTAAGMP